MSKRRPRVPGMLGDRRAQLARIAKVPPEHFSLEELEELAKLRRQIDAKTAELAVAEENRDFWLKELDSIREDPIPRAGG